MAKGTQRITREELMDFITYNPETGIFYWNVFHSSAAKNGGIAGTTDRQGYRRIIIKGKIYRAHHLAWFIVNKKWPHEQIDHINGVKSDNSINNLREATNSQNSMNRGLRVDNKHGYKGVSACGKKWKAEIKHDKRRIYLGVYATPEEAHAVYANEEKKLRGEYARGWDGKSH